MFRIGQKVVCVDARPPICIPGHPTEGLVLNAIYTVAAIGLVHPYDPDELPCISVEEIDDPASPNGLTYLWRHRFRPVVERKTDTGFEVIEDIRKRESIPANERVRALVTPAHPTGASDA